MKIIFNEEAIKNLKKYPSLTNIKKLKNHYPPYRYRIRTYRVLFDIENENIIIFKIVHRKDAY